MKINVLFFIIGLILIPITGITEEKCPASDPVYYEECMIDRISSLVSEKKYGYALDLLNGYEEWYRGQKEKDTKGIARILSSKAAIYYFKGDYEEALKTFNDALKLYESLKDMDRIAETQTNISIVLASTGRYEDAIRIIENVKNYYKRERREIDLADAYLDEGIFYFFDNNLLSSFNSFSSAERLYLKNNLKIRYLTTQILKGIVKAKMQDYKEGLYLCENNMLSFSLKYYCIAIANEGLGKKKEALDAYREAIKRIDKNINTAIYNSGDKTAQALSEKYSPIFTDYLLFILKNSLR